MHTVLAKKKVKKKKSQTCSIYLCCSVVFYISVKVTCKGIIIIIRFYGAQGGVRINTRSTPPSLSIFIVPNIASRHNLSPSVFQSRPETLLKRVVANIRL
jgi:hypothetical protein